MGNFSFLNDDNFICTLTPLIQMNPKPLTINIFNMKIGSRPPIMVDYLEFLNVLRIYEKLYERDPQAPFEIDDDILYVVNFELKIYSQLLWNTESITDYLSYSF